MFWTCKYATSSRIDEILDEYKTILNPTETVADASETTEETDKTGDESEETAEGDVATNKVVLSNNQNSSEVEISILTELLLEDDLLQEVRTKNQQLLDFLCRKTVFDFMISQIVTEPPEGNVEMSERFKKPSIISEILSSCTDQICDSLMSDNRLDKLWTLLSQTDPINPLQASFFSKVVTSLFPTYAKQFSEFLVKRSHIMSSLVSHIGNSAFADVIMRIVTYQENEAIRDEILSYMKEQKLVSLLIKSLGSAQDNQAKMNSAMVLEDLIRLSRDHLIATLGDEQSNLAELQESQCAFLRDILSQESVELLLGQMNDNSNDITTVGFTVKLFVSMITAKPMALSLAGANEVFSSNTLTVLNQTVSLAFHILNSVVDRLCTAFKSPPQQTPVTLSNAEAPLVPFGWVRLEIVEFVVATLDQFTSDMSFFVENCSETLIKIAQSDLLSSIIDTFFIFTNNNILHGLTVKLIRSYLSICTTLKTMTDEKSQHLLEADLPKCLLSNTLLLRQLDSAWEYELNRRTDSADTSDKQCVSVPRGNFGHVVALTEDINKYLTENNSVEMYLDDDFRQHWNDIVTEEVSKILKEYEKPLGGTNPNKCSTDDDDTTSVLLSFSEEPALQKAFLEYSTQEMTTDTSHFESLTGPRDLDEFFSGKSLPVPQFNQPIISSMSDVDHERSANLFESLCEQRLNTFKDLDDDETNDMESAKLEDDQNSLNQTFSASFDAKFSEVFGSPESTTASANADFFASSSEGVDPFASYDLFSSSPFKDDPPSKESAPTVPFVPSDPFSGAATGDEASNWANFTDFAAVTHDFPPVPPPVEKEEASLVLQSMDSSEESPSAVATSDPFVSKQPEAPSLPDEDAANEELGQNFSFLASSGLAKSFSLSVGGDTPKEG